MSIIDLFFIGLSLSADAFAVSICQGVKTPTPTFQNRFLPPFLFGLFQAIMPLLGYVAGVQIQSYMSPYHTIVACVLLCILGLKMVWESFHTPRDDAPKEGIWALVLLAIATSIDALAVGVSFAMVPDLQIGPAVVLIGSITFALCLIGICAGQTLGGALGKKAEFLGGLTLILIGLRLLA